MYFRYYLPLEQNAAFNLYQTKSNDALDQVSLNWAQWFLKRLKCEQFTDRRTTDNRRSENLTWALKAQMN